MEKEIIFNGTTDFPIGIFSQDIYFTTPHHHIECEIFYLTKGECLIGIDEKEYQIKAGDCIFLEPGSNHYVKPVKKEEQFHYYAICFDSSVFGDESDASRQVFEHLRIKRFLELSEEIEKEIESIVQKQKDAGFGYQFLIKAVLFRIISFIIQTNQFVEISTEIDAVKRMTPNSVIESALLYIKEHYRENLSLEDLLELTAYSKSHFIRMFKNATGMNYTDYVNKYRIEKSCIDLIYSDKNITQIATENGFNNIQYYSKIFKHYMLVTPKQYQKRGRTIIVPSTVASVK
ncbi:MAG: helix-turn-helix domain-containing protein [Treponema sp.]|nr:helix-turn-helix domain-containing protein [Treponema sp.]